MIKKEDLKWRPVKYLRIGGTEQFEFEFQCYEPLASWDVYEHWERERVRHMRANLNKGEILYDIGAEMGWLSVIYGQMVGPSNMVLIEPTGPFWPNIKAMWTKNFDAHPLATYHGLFSDKTTSKKVDDVYPLAARGDVIEKLAYTYIHDNEEEVPEITLDEYVKQTGIVPNALTMDTEGSELLILKGAKDTLAHHNLKVWVSIHDDLAERDYAIKPGETIKFMEEQGYTARHLATDHEAHWYFER